MEKQIDLYYVDLVRDCLLEAEKALASSQKYIRNANLPDGWDSDVKRILNKVRRTNDDLAKIKVFE